MTTMFPSEAWTQAFRDAVNANPTYRDAGREWTFGSVAMVIRAEPERGVAEDVGMILDVHEGQCRSAKYVTSSNEPENASFLIKASYDDWVEVIRGDLDPIAGMMGGRLELQKGHLPTMIRFVEASRALVSSASNIQTSFLHES